jgi:hypothetical protein
MDENQLARRLLALLQQNPNLDLGEVLLRSGIEIDRSRITQFRHYRGTPQDILKLLVPAVIESVNLSIPVIIESQDMLIPALIYKRETIFGDAAILFFTVHEYEGPHSSSDCPCDRRVARQATWNNSRTQVNYTCVPTCGSEAEFRTMQECQAAPPRGSEAVGTEYWATKVLDDGSGNFGGFPPTGLQPISEYFSFSTPYVIRHPAHKIQHYHAMSNTEEGYFTCYDGAILHWDEVEIYQVGRAIEYMKGIGNVWFMVLTNTGFFAGIGGAKTVWPSSMRAIVGKDIENCPPGMVVTRADFYDVNNNGVLNFRKFGYFTGAYASQSHRLDFGNFAFHENITHPTTEDNKHYKIIYWLGGVSPAPIKLKECLIQDGAQGKVLWGRVGGFSSQIQRESDGSPSDYLSDINAIVGQKAYISAIGPNKYEIIIKSGQYTEDVSNTVTVNGSPEQSFNLKWCTITKILWDNGQKTTTEYRDGQNVEVSDKNNYKFLATRWYAKRNAPQNLIRDYRSGSNYAGGNKVENESMTNVNEIISDEDLTNLSIYDWVIRRQAKFYHLNFGSALYCPGSSSLSIQELLIQSGKLANYPLNWKRPLSIGYTIELKDESIYFSSIRLNQPFGTNIFLQKILTKD